MLPLKKLVAPRSKSIYADKSQLGLGWGILGTDGIGKDGTGYILIRLKHWRC